MLSLYNNGNNNLPEITIADITVSESDSTAEITVSLSEAIASPVTVNYSTADDSATSGSDYVGKSGTLTFSPNQTSQTITVNLSDDNLVENSESFFVNLSNPSVNATLADDQGIVTIEDNDTKVNGVVKSDYDALVALYNSTDGANWKNNTNWLTNANVSDWHGVTVEGDRVTRINLSQNNLVGNLPTELGNLSNLRTLSFSNSVRITPPSTSTPIGNNANKLSGTIPTELGNLSNLQFLSLNGNKLSGTIPTELGNLSNLQFLSLVGNNLNGKIPSTLGNLSNLRDLNLRANFQISGKIPLELSNLSNLTTLSLGFNKLSAEIPPELGNLSNLRDLYLYVNQLVGEIPSELNNLYNLKFLFLNNNELTGNISSGLGELESLEYLRLEKNRLIGNIPTTISDRSWTQLNLENPPYVASEIPNQQIDPNNDVNIDLSGNFADLNSDSISYRAVGLPDGLTLDSNTGIITGQTSSIGNYDVTITGTDNDGSVETSFELNVTSNLPNSISNNTPSELELVSENLLAEPLSLTSGANNNEFAPLNQTTNSGEIKGQIWYDQNPNGTQEENEPGLEGWVVFLDRNQNAKFDFDEPFSVTDENGNYSFTNLDAGTYTVVQFTNEGWTQTYPEGYSNGDFESGDFSDWLTIGDRTLKPTGTDADFTQGNFQAQITSRQGSVLVGELESFLGLNGGSLNNLSNSFPSQGTIRRNVTEGSAIAKTITVSAGDRLTFDYNFLTNDYLPYNDFAFSSVSSATTERIASIQSDLEVSSTNFVEETGLGTFSHTFTNSGTFTIGVGVVDVGDRIVDSALLVDNFTLTANDYIVNINSGESIDNLNFGNYLANIPQTIQFSAANYIVTEEATIAEIILTRSGDTSTPASVTVELNNGTAQGGSDFDATSQTVNFASEEVSKTITIPITNDNLVEAEENLILSLTNANNADIGAQNTAIVTIIDNETLVEFSQPTYQINEDGTSAGVEITVIRSGDTSIGSSVELAFSDGTAVGGNPFLDFGEDESGETTLELRFPDGVDFDKSQIQLPDGEITNTRKVFFDRGENSKTVTFPINDDDLLEGSENLILSLTNPSTGTTIGSQLDWHFVS